MECCLCRRMHPNRLPTSMPYLFPAKWQQKPLLLCKNKLPNGTLFPIGLGLPQSLCYAEKSYLTLCLDPVRHHQDTRARLDLGSGDPVHTHRHNDIRHLARKLFAKTLDSHSKLNEAVEDTKNDLQRYKREDLPKAIKRAKQKIKFLDDCENLLLAYMNELEHGTYPALLADPSRFCPQICMHHQKCVTDWHRHALHHLRKTGADYPRREHRRSNRRSSHPRSR